MSTTQLHSGQRTDAFARSFFSILDAAYDGVRGVSSEIQNRGLLPAVTESWFRMQYGVIQATTPLLRFAVDALDRRPSDAFSETLRAFYAEKLEDEAGHEKLLLADCERLGISEKSLVDELTPSPITALVGSQYYVLAYHHPAVHLGYIGLLEGYAPSVDDARKLAKASGAPEEAFSTLHLHAEVDLDHRRSLEAILDAVPDDPALRRAIVANGLRSAEFYCQALEGLLEE